MEMYRTKLFSLSSHELRLSRFELFKYHIYEIGETSITITETSCCERESRRINSTASFAPLFLLIFSSLSLSALQKIEANISHMLFFSLNFELLWRYVSLSVST
jgi:hypothetical protein